MKSSALILSVFATVADAHAFGLAPYYHTLELMWLQDFSSSFEDDMPFLTSQFGDAIEELKWVFPHSRFGLGGFVDKPIEPFGYPESADYCYQLRYKLTRYTPRLRQSLSSAKIHSGHDWPEAQLHALMGAALQEETGWSVNDTTPNGYNIHRLMVVVTDAGFHQAGDSKLTANNGDAEVDCLGEDYPSINQVKDALARKRITPVFLVTNEVVNLYRRLVRDLGNNGIVWEIEDDSSNVRHALSAAINAKLNNDCDGKRCDGGCIGEGCCHGNRCENEAVLIHLEDMPKNIKVIVDEN